MNKKVLFTIDWGLVSPAVILVILSLTTLFSINADFFKNQLLFFGISLCAFLFFSQTNFKIIEKYSIAIYILSIMIFTLILIFGIESRGSVRWFEIFGLKIQFSEIFKPLLAISLASFLTKKKKHSLKTFFLTLGLLIPIAFLIFLQPDLGNAVIYVLVVLFALCIFGIPWRLFLLFFTLVAFSIPFVWRYLHGYQKQRIITFLNPSDPEGHSYNTIQAIIAIGSGMIFGRGFGMGTQSGLRFLPERHTDFIFSTLAEELGFIGTLVVLVTFVYLLYRIFFIFLHSDETFYRLFCIVAFYLILLQFFINVGMNIGLLPVVGVTLPFMSYGGSSLLSNFILLGMLSAISKKAIHRDVLEIR